MRNETVIKKGNPLHSSEVRTALKAGKMLKRAKVNMALSEQVWNLQWTRTSSNLVE